MLQLLSVQRDKVQWQFKNTEVISDTCNVKKKLQNMEVPSASEYVKYLKSNCMIN
jgi:hypothetical protein